VRVNACTPSSIGAVSIHSCGVCSPEPLVTPIAIDGMPSACAAFASVLLAAKYLRRHPLESERPLLNERAVQLVGQSFNLVDPIVNGRGSIKTGDTIWRVEGPELPEGARIKVVGADGTVLKVTPT